ncbi:ATP-binding protein [Streptomyces sp. CB00455]|uniref:ATP-binding protein n=1 Tax=Streptomyces sp. CB00455 TaxID=1703927 RepID=UPI00093FAD90|nr:ATP-binding protein [Streptomyces sp. CB00455]OKK22926.1 ATP-binding protein [Streptomyces sp. CB00455]
MQQTQTPEHHESRPAEVTYRPQRVAQARQAASQFLARLHPSLSASAAQDVVLLVSELVTNAIRHAGGVTAMVLRARPDSIEVVVEDPSPVAPQDRSPDLTGRTGGFGWPMVRRLARAVAVQRGPGGGKVIVACVAR